MPHIDLIEPKEATGAAAELFRTAQESFGVVPEPLKLFAASPLTARHVFEGFAASMEQTVLSQSFFAWLRYLVADHARCLYCVDVNVGILLGMGVEQEILIAALKDAAVVPLPEGERKLLQACLHMTRGDRRLEKADMDDLKGHGYTDADLIIAFHHAAHAQAVDTMINAFGL